MGIYTMSCKSKIRRQGGHIEWRKKMSEFQMIEMLAEKENVSFEEARDTLRACSGDLIEAVVYLERKAKASAEQHHPGLLPRRQNRRLRP